MIRPDMIERHALAALDVPSFKSESDDDEEDYFITRPEPAIDANGVGRVSVAGTLLDSCPPIYERLGIVTCYPTIINEAQSLIAKGARSILFVVDSPGGMVGGNAETCGAIKSLGVPTAAFAVGMACSAAYKIAASTDLIIATPSAEVGNIGVILSWADCTGFWQEMGIEMKALTNKGADLKSTFHLEPNANQLVFLQEKIDQMGADFREWIETNRPQVDAEVFRAGWYCGLAAESMGLIDGMGTIEDASEELATRNFDIGK